MFYKKDIGQRGEKIAAKYYQQLGYKILQTNYSNRYGEIDIIAEKNGLVLLIEVKTRCNDRYGTGEESVNDAKIQKIQKTYQLCQTNNNTTHNFDIEVCTVEINQNKISIHRFNI